MADSNFKISESDTKLISISSASSGITLLALAGHRGTKQAKFQDVRTDLVLKTRNA